MGSAYEYVVEQRYRNKQRPGASSRLPDGVTVSTAGPPVGWREVVRSRAPHCVISKPKSAPVAGQLLYPDYSPMWVLETEQEGEGEIERVERRSVQKMHAKLTSLYSGALYDVRVIAVNSELRC